MLSAALMLNAWQQARQRAKHLRLVARSHIVSHSQHQICQVPLRHVPEAEFGHVPLVHKVAEAGILTSLAIARDVVPLN